MPKRTTGRYERTTVGGEEVAAFIPLALPPADPPLAVDSALAERLRAAEQALVRLELAGEMVPSLDWFIYAFVRKEAVLSSQIEGTQATLVDLLAFEAQEGRKRADRAAERRRRGGLQLPRRARVRARRSSPIRRGFRSRCAS